MRHVPTDKHTIAWFKLAECIARGEREKAYGVYRLLAHSLSDQAYALQLEGDLLRCFDDARAFEKYRQALQLYYQEQRWLQAAGVGAHLESFQEITIPVREILVEVHSQLENTAVMLTMLQELIISLIKAGAVEQISTRFDQLFAVPLEPSSLLPAWSAIITVAIAHHGNAADIKEWIKRIMAQYDAVALQQYFLPTLAQSSPSYHRIAQQFLPKS